MKLKNEYSLKQREAAKIVAYMKDGLVYENNESLQVVDRSELNTRILQLISEKNYTGVNELIKAANSEDDISTDNVSKSIRIPFTHFYKLFLLSERKDMSFADVVRKISAPHLDTFLSSLNDDSSIAIDKFNYLIGMIKKWDAKKVKRAASAERFYVLGANALSLEDKVTEVFDSLVMKFVEIRIGNLLKRNNLPEDMSNVYVASYLAKGSLKDKNWYLEQNHFIESFYANLKPSNDSITVRLDLNYSTADLPCEFDESVQEQLLGKYDQDTFDKFVAVYEHYGLDLSDFDFGEFVITQDETGIKVDGCDLINDASTLKQSIYLKLNSNYCTDSSNKESCTLLPDFDATEFEQKLKELILEGDLETASHYSEPLHKHQVLTDLSSLIYDILVGITGDSRVITFTIPRPLLSLLELAKEDAPLSRYIMDILESSYNEDLKEIEFNN